MISLAEPRNGDLPRELVVLVHGLAAHRVMMQPLERRIRRRGYRTFNWGYRSIWSPVQRHSQRLHSVLSTLADDTSIEAVHLVAHSLGAIVARQAALISTIPKLQSIVMLGPPNHGSRVARFLTAPLGWICQPLGQLSDAEGSYVRGLGVPAGVEIGVIAALHDRVVSPESTHLTSQQDHRVVPTGHGRMLFRREVADLVCEFLCRRSFSPGREEATSASVERSHSRTADVASAR